MTWKVLFATSSRDHCILGNLFSQLDRLSNAKRIFMCTFDALLTVFKGHVVACACRVLEIDRPDANIPHARS